MGVEAMIYIYGVVCVSMIVFNTLYSFAMRRREPRLEKREARLRAAVAEELAAVRQGKSVSEAHIDYLARSLSKVNNLLAFDKVMAPLFSRQEDEVNRRYLDQLQPMPHLMDVNVHPAKTEVRTPKGARCPLTHFRISC